MPSQERSTLQLSSDTPQNSADHSNSPRSTHFTALDQSFWCFDCIKNGTFFIIFPRRSTGRSHVDPADPLQASKLAASNPERRASKPPRLSSLDQNAVAHITSENLYDTPLDTQGIQMHQAASFGRPVKIFAGDPGPTPFTRRPSSRPSSATVRRPLTSGMPSAATIQQGGDVHDGALSLQGLRVGGASSAFSQSELRRAAARRVDLRTRAGESRRELNGISQR